MAEKEELGKDFPEFDSLNRLWYQGYRLHSKGDNKS